MTVTVELAGDGSGVIRFPTHQVPLDGTNAASTRERVVAELTGYAAQTTAAVHATIYEQSGVTGIVVYPNGAVEATGSAQVAPQPTNTSQSPSVPSTPPATPPQPAAMLSTSTEKPKAATPAAVEPSTDFPFAQDPEWQAEANKPATTGFTGWLNSSLHMTWPAKGKELTHRQEEFLERKNSEWIKERERQEAEAQRHREEQQRAAEAARQQRDADERNRAAAERRAALQAEREARIAALNANIQTNFQGTQTILVANPKGGARKTTTTYILGATIGAIRGGSTVAWDANETMGTLGERAQKDRHSRTVVDLLEDGARHFLSIDNARVGILDGYVRNQGDAHFDVLASDESPSRQDIIDGEGFAKVHDILEHFYRMILVDTGNNIRAAHFVAALETADQLVIPVAASHDSKNRALDMIQAFTAGGHDDLVANAVVLVHELEPIERDAQGVVTSNNGHEATAQEVADAFEGRVRAVLPVPYDAALKDGGEIDVNALTQATGDAYRLAADAIATSLLERDEARSRANH